MRSADSDHEISSSLKPHVRTFPESGSAADIGGLGRLLDSLEDLECTGQLRLWYGRWSGEIDIDTGRPVAARFGTESGFAALEVMILALSDGEYEFVERSVAGEADVDLDREAVEYLLGRLVTYPGLWPRLGSVPEPVDAFTIDGATGPETQGLSSRARDILALVDGRRTVDQIIGKRPLTETLDELSVLRDKRLIAFDPRAAVSAPARVATGLAAPLPLKGPSYGSERGWTAATIGFLLGAMVLAIVGVQVITPEDGLLTGYGLWNQMPGVATSSRQGASSEDASPAQAPQPSVVRTASPNYPQPTAAADDAAATVLSSAAPARPTPKADSVTVAATPEAAVATAIATSATPFRTLLENQFSQASDVTTMGWPNDPRGVGWLADGSYHVALTQPTDFLVLRAPVSDSLRDVVVTASLRKVSGPDEAAFGLAVRDQRSSDGSSSGLAERFYAFEINDRGDVSIRRKDGDGWTDLAPWARSSSVRTGQASNQLTVQAIGANLYFLVNGVQVGSQRDNALATGGVGLFVDGETQIALDRLLVRGIH
jgi:hypothetical protein